MAYRRIYAYTPQYPQCPTESEVFWARLITWYYMCMYIHTPVYHGISCFYSHLYCHILSMILRSKRMDRQALGQKTGSKQMRPTHLPVFPPLEGGRAWQPPMVPNNTWTICQLKCMSERFNYMYLLLCVPTYIHHITSHHTTHTTLHYITLHCSTVHYSTLQYITLHT